MDERWIFNRPKIKDIRSVSVRRLIVVFIFLFVSYGNQLFFRIVYCFVEPDFKLTSDPRQDGQSSPFTTRSSQKGHGMRNCRAFIVA